MFSRDTTLHFGAVAVASAFLLAVRYGLGHEGEVPLWAVLLFYGVALGGSHLYLGLRGEDGLVPALSRWRYLTALAVLLLAAATLSYASGQTIAAIDLGTVAATVAVVTVAWFFLTESVEGYRASRSE